VAAEAGANSFVAAEGKVVAVGLPADSGIAEQAKLKIIRMVMVNNFYDGS